jgi:hypothetical protein
MTTRGARQYIEHNIWKETQGDGSEKYFTIHPETHETIEIAADQVYFWTAEWQAKEREADEDIAAGRVKTFDTMDAFLADLDHDDE